MRLTRYAPVLQTLIGGMLIHFAGCTAIGYYYGRGIDRHNSVLQETPLQEAATVEKDVQVRIITRDDDTFYGEFIEIAPVTETVYAGSYDSLKALHDTSGFPPGLGDIVTVYMKSGHSLAGRFNGFDLYMTGDHDGTAPASRTEAEDRFAMFQYCIIGPPDDPEPSRVFVGDISRIVVSNADTLGGKVLHNLARSGSLPLRSAIALNSNGVRKSVPVTEVSHFSSMHLRGNARWVGLGLGILIDAAAVAAVTVLTVQWWFGDFGFGLK